MRTLEIKKNDANQRLDKFLQKRFKTLPKSLMYKYIRKKCIKVNGKKCDIQTMLKEGDVLTFYIKDEFFEASEQKSYEFMKAPKTFDIVYEDENLILIDKKPGIIVHPDKNYHFDSLVARVKLQTGIPPGVYFNSGSWPKRPRMITLLTLMKTLL